MDNASLLSKHEPSSDLQLARGLPLERCDLGQRLSWAFLGGSADNTSKFHRGERGVKGVRSNRGRYSLVC